MADHELMYESEPSVKSEIELTLGRTRSHSERLASQASQNPEQNQGQASAGGETPSLSPTSPLSASRLELRRQLANLAARASQIQQPNSQVLLPNAGIGTSITQDYSQDPTSVSRQSPSSSFSPSRNLLVRDRLAALAARLHLTHPNFPALPPSYPFSAGPPTSLTPTPSLAEETQSMIPRLEGYIATRTRQNEADRDEIIRRLEDIDRRAEARERKTETAEKGTQEGKVEKAAEIGENERGKFEEQEERLNQLYEDILDLLMN
ncbi:hypothetical protein BKA64DRAFT_308384 [Cadophora sp. MPI-SDFR-AT-0126]|nr:hypothetical protein BKA64DRAFT_308384 [Leotiomycetes sp. MPI-SDFR-AT-0126]